MNAAERYEMRINALEEAIIRNKREHEAEVEYLRRKLDAVCRERDQAYEERAALVGRLAFDEERGESSD